MSETNHRDREITAGILLFLAVAIPASIAYWAGGWWLLAAVPLTILAALLVLATLRIARPHPPAVAAAGATEPVGERPRASDAAIARWKAEGRDHWAKMDRGNRLTNRQLLGVDFPDINACNDRQPHRWQPVSFRFETQLLDGEGRVRIRQPDLHAAHVYLVCLGCNSHTYVETEWAGFYLGGPGQGTAGPDPVLSVFDDEEGYE